MGRIGEHAVVLGAGVAGLLSAAALARAYEHVTIIERDLAPAPGENRRGVPQGRHAHVVMPRGAQAFEELLPGICLRMLAAGAVPAEPLTDYRLRVGGHQLRQVPIGGPVIQASRPFLEHYLRVQVGSAGDVEVVDGCDVAGLLTGDRGDRVTGVRVLPRTPGSAEEQLPADLVVDATGRGSRTPAWLAEHGYPRPLEERFAVDVGYASRVVRLPADATGVEKAVGTGPVPGRPRGMMMLAVEGDRRLLTLVGFTAEHRPPTDDDGFLAFAETVAPPDVFEAISAAEPLGPAVAYRYPAYLRRHYRRLRRFPDGLVVTGDAVCSFSPIYAQGMTVAALEALALRRCLDRGPRHLARRFFAAVDRVVDNAWQMAVNADLALPEVSGRRTSSVRLVNRYVGRVLAAAEHDDLVARQFMRVTGMLDSPAHLFRPAVVRRALTARPAAVPAPDLTAVSR